MKILIVDDEKNIRLTLSEILGDEGHQTISAETGEKALALLAKDKVKIVILDVKLPGIDGIEVFKEIKNSHPDLEVLMISGHSDISTAVEAVKLGAYDFLEKPLYLAKVLTAVRNIEEKHKLLIKVDQTETDKMMKYRMAGESPQMQKVREFIEKVGLTDSKVLIRGESGTGKELAAYAIHHKSHRKGGPFIKFNSAAIPNELVESELFGHEKGAFTGADQHKLGKLEIADGGTLFLDEIGDMNINAQAKILRVIQEGMFEHVGSNKTIEIDVRILAATNQNLEKMIEEGKFREDLYFRINVVPITLPPLREREGDIESLTNYFLKYYAYELKVQEKKFSPTAIKRLKTYHFPGNVRELKNLIERLYILKSDDIITEDDIAQHIISPNKKQSHYDFIDTKTFNKAKREFEVQYLTEQLKKFGWSISKTARQLGMHQPNLSRKINELKIKREI